ncbi:hypothetical protein HG530_009054 [Fusarium avenaceum]|nr:hypothetical protein HG530_009054 [Fusarium avenaceum]
MGEHRVVAKLAEGKLTVVAVGTEIFHGMQRLAEASQSFAEVIFVSFLGSAGVKSTIVDTSCEAVSQIGSAGCPVSTFVRNVILHTCARVDFSLYLFYRASQSFIEGTRIEPLSVSKRVVDMFFWAVDSETVGGNLKFTSSIAMSHK